MGQGRQVLGRERELMSACGPERTLMSSYFRHSGLIPATRITLPHFSGFVGNELGEIGR